jgi:ribosomal protein S14
MAPVWGWILAYLLGFMLIQAVVYWYLHGDGTPFEEPTPGYSEGDPAARPSIDRTDRETAVTGESIQCPYCGTSNEREQSYTYCRECVRELL